MVVVLVIGIPVLINEAYKMETFYVTTWDSSDVLMFYGVLLGVMGAVYVLSETIKFSIRQIQAEHFIERENIKWNKVEEVTMEALKDIMPFNMLYLGGVSDGSTFAYLSKIITQLQNYSFKAKTSLDRIKCYISPVDYPKIEILISETHKAILDFCKIEAELEDLHRKHRNDLLSYHGVFPQEVLKDYNDDLSKIMEKILPAQEEQYQRLFNIKRDIFTNIYADIDRQAGQILEFGRKGDSNNANT